MRPVAPGRLADQVHVLAPDLYSRLTLCDLLTQEGALAWTVDAVDALQPGRQPGDVVLFLDSACVHPERVTCERCRAELTKLVLERAVP